jgi:hypothetical protein
MLEGMKEMFRRDGSSEDLLKRRVEHLLLDPGFGPCAHKVILPGQEEAFILEQLWVLRSCQTLRRFGPASLVQRIDAEVKGRQASRRKSN